MSGNGFARKRIVVALGLALAVMPLVSSANQARVDFAFGEVTLKNVSGARSALSKGATVGSGDTIVTGSNARVQLRFSDGSYMSLQPESEFRIDQYQFNGNQDGSERGFFSLLKGGLRTITGLVGRSNKKNYQVSTGVATIGIRGTEYSISADGQVRGSVGNGEIQVCNGGGCLVVANGESYRVQTPSAAAMMTEKKVDLPAPPVQPGIATINVGGPGASSNGGKAAGEIVTSAPSVGDYLESRTKSKDEVKILAEESSTTPGVNPNPNPFVPPSGGSTTPPVTVEFTGITGALAHTGYAFEPAGGIVRPRSLADAFFINAAGPGSKLFDDSNNALVAAVAPVEAYKNAILHWGRFVDPAFTGSGPFTTNASIASLAPTMLDQQVHYVYGQATPVAAIPTTGTVIYNFVGASAPSFSNGSENLGIGITATGGINVNFTTGNAGLSLAVRTPVLSNGGEYFTIFNGTGDIYRGNALKFPILSGNVVNVISGPPCSCTLGGEARGFFAGPNAEAVGMNFVVNINGDRGVGVVVFNK